jgi:hypothetical protein
VIDETSDVAADGGVAAPRPVDPKHPDAPIGEIPQLAGIAVAVPDQLAGVVDDAAVLGDGFLREDTEAVDCRTPPRQFGEGFRDAACQRPGRSSRYVYPLRPSS